MVQPDPKSRRPFLQSRILHGVGAAGATLAIGRGVHAAGSDLIKIALVGCGGRGTGAAAQAINAMGGKLNVKLIAMADSFQGRLETSLQGIQKRCKDRPGTIDVPPERQFVGLDAYEKVMATDADLVLLCTPPGFRPMQFEAAIGAGKHVFMEKPIACDSPGARRVQAANELAKEKGLAVAVGLNGRHSMSTREAVARVHDEALGDVRLMRIYFNSSGVWVRPREPGETEMQYQVKNWYYFNWLSGGQVVEQHVHLLDYANWVMQEAHPVRANGMGGRQCRSGPEWGEIFDHHAVEFDYEDGAKLISFCRHQKGCWMNISRHVLGTKGRMDSERTGTVLRMGDGEPRTYEKDVQDTHQTEHDHLFAALLAGEPYNEGDYGVASTFTAIMGRMATHSGKVVTWDDVVNSELDLSPDGYDWDSTPQPTPGEDGNYPCPVPGVTKAW